MKNEKKYQTVGTVPKSNRKIGETSKIDAINAQRYERSFFWLGTCASIKSGGVKYLPSNKTVIMSTGFFLLSLALIYYTLLCFL